MESAIAANHCGLNHVAHGKVDDERDNTRKREIDLADGLARLAQHIPSLAFVQREVRLECFENFCTGCGKKPVRRMVHEIRRMVHATSRCSRRERDRVSQALAAQARPAMLESIGAAMS